MVTLDNTLVNVGEFKGDLEAGRRNYERAVQGLELIVEEKSQLEASLKDFTGFDNFNLPLEPTENTLKRGSVEFAIKSDARIKRPAYKEAVTGMENYLDGIAFLLSQGRDISGIFKRKNLIFVDVERLFGAFDIIVGGVLLPEVEHTIRYKAYGDLADEGAVDKLTLRQGRNPASLTEENVIAYVRMDRLAPILAAYVEAYRGELTKGQRKPEKLIPVTTKSAYKSTKLTAVGPNWAYVVKTLVTVPTDDKTVGELNLLNEPSLSRVEKQNMFPHYQLGYRRDNPTILYVSIQSIDQRIKDLIKGKKIEAARTFVEPVEIV